MSHVNFSHYQELSAGWFASIIMANYVKGTLRAKKGSLCESLTLNSLLKERKLSPTPVINENPCVAYHTETAKSARLDSSHQQSFCVRCVLVGERAMTVLLWIYIVGRVVIKITCNSLE